MNRITSIAMWAAVVLVGAACSQIPERPSTPEDIKAHVEQVFSPIIPSLDDHLTDGTAQQILMHNCVGYRLGYWETPGMAEACDFTPDKHK